VAVQQIRYRGFKLYHENPEATRSMCSQGESFPTFFSPRTDRPLIIDCGSNIGVTMLEWKHRWPGAQVICFEPDPRAFRLLQMNVDKNDIPSVRCNNAAVSDIEGTATFYGHFTAGSDSRGNSIDPGWGQRHETGTHLINCHLLSKYLEGQDVDFLKLDIEGAEERVLKEITAHLHRVAAIYVEVHETKATLGHNSEERISEVLREAGFNVEAEQRDGAMSLPPSERQWQGRVGSQQAQLMGWR